jgi:hypothetical protein
LGQLFQQPENEMVTAAIDKLRTKISGVLLPELETMTKEAKELAKEAPFNHWIFTSPGTMIGPCRGSSPLPISSSGSTNSFQHDRQSDSQMKTQDYY